MRLLHELPDDVLIPIFSICDINTIFSLRLTCTALNGVFDAYVKTIAPAVAHFTFPGCNVLLEPPKNGYSLQWLRGLIPAQLASIALDKDKLRRSPYINSGFPYGIPSESNCQEARYWRERVTNGWRVLRSLYLISKEVYAKTEDELKRPNAIRRASSGMRSSRLWQAVSCPYPGCTEHGLKQIFDNRRGPDTRGSDPKENHIADITRREAIILRKRLALIQHISDQDLLSYVYLWRLLIWSFRPYMQPGTAQDFMQDWEHHADAPQTAWFPIISDISQGCSWLTWFVLSVGPSPFLQQWCPILSATSSSTANPSTANLLRTMIWKAYESRTQHQIEVEREHIYKFEFALRKRCLSSDRLKRLETEIVRGSTISLDCIPWYYDQHPMITRPPCDFPWYKDEQWVWLDGDWSLQIRAGSSWAQPGALKANLKKCQSQDWEAEEFESNAGEGSKPTGGKGPLENVRYLVYLGVQEADKIWTQHDPDAAELVF